MDEMGITRVMKELARLLQDISITEAEECGRDERIEAIKRELGSWFIDGYTLYQAS
ncbi:MAG: hypothetical protein KAT65_06860 [Methanophagales archaeon]|nr:hypothetical protein [Methanophagales archaeon]